MNNKLQSLLDEHIKMPFPPAYRGQELEGVDLMLVGADTAACTMAFIRNKGSLDIRRCAVLGLCYRDLTLICKKLKGEAKAYFEVLWEGSKI